MKIKRLLSAFLTICLLSSLFCVSPAISEELYLDQGGSVWYSEEFSFVPEESGFYCIYMDWCSCSGINAYIDACDSDYTYVSAVAAVGDELSYKYTYYYLVEGVEYIFNILPSDCFCSGSGTYYLLTHADVTDMGPYTIGDEVSVQVSNEKPVFYTYTAASSCEILFSVNSGDVCVYDVNDNEVYSNYAQLSLQAIEGHEYYIFLVANDPISITLTSTYVEELDNSPVYTSNIDEMQSSHPYQNNQDKKWIYTAPEGTLYNEIIFDTSCYLGWGDTIYVYNANETQIGQYNYSSVASKKLTILGDKFTIRLVSNSSDVYYGFGLSSINSYSVVPAPSASIESGTIRPSKVSINGISVATFFYKLSTQDNEGEFIEYTDAIEIKETCTLSIYAKIGDSVSETVTYNYEVDASDLPKPEFVVKSSSTSSITLGISATEGDVYYKKMATDSSFRKVPTSGTVTVYESDVIAAYAINGTLKSEIAYYNCNITDNQDHELVDPIITETPILGGKTVTISIPEGFEYINDYVTTNYGASHFSYECGWDEYSTHSMDSWSEKSEDTYTFVSGGTADERMVNSNYYSREDFPKTYTVYQNAVFTAKSKYVSYYNAGEWEEIEENMGFGVLEYRHEPVNYDSEYVEKTSSRIYKYVEVPKAQKPTISEIDGKVHINAENGCLIYYSINDGEEIEYTEPLDIKGNNVIRAYAIGMGVTQSDIVEYTMFLSQTADPVPNYASGEVFKGTIIEFTSYNDGAETTIYYTTDNTEPSDQSTLYTGGIVVNEPMTIKAIAYSTDRHPSEVVTYSYTLRTTKNPVVEEVNAKGGKKIYLSSETENAVVYYTLDGTDPMTSETAILYEAPFVIGTDGTVIRAYAKADRYVDSEIIGHTVSIGQLPSPLFSVTDENVYLNTELTITAESIADIYYTLDGTEPTEESNLYSSPIVITDDVTVKAIAIADGWENSNVSEKSYKVYVTGIPYITKTALGNYMKIELKSETPDATIYYTLDGTNPAEKSLQYKEPILLSEDTTVKAFAVSENRKQSDVYTETILVRHTINPVSNLPSGEIKTTDKIELTASLYATIYYTLDGTEPTMESNVYTEPFSISKDIIVKAYAVEEGFLDSSVVIYEYTLKRARNPEISLNEDILGGKSIKIETEDEGATIYYTLDGTEPTTSSPVYTEPFDIYETTEINAISVVSDCLNGSSYREMEVPVASFSKSLLNYNGNIDKYVLRDDVIEDNWSEHIVHYTLDGTEPLMTSSVYELGTIVIDEDKYIRAFAIGYGYAKSEVISIMYTIRSSYTGISIKRGENDAEITLEPYPGNATVYYTLDESDPGDESNENRVLYTGSFKITENTWIRTHTSAYRYKSTYEKKMLYTNMANTPKIRQTAKNYEIYSELYKKMGEAVELYSPDGINIRYTLDGTDPTATNGIEYVGPIYVDKETTIKAYCYGDNYVDSNVRTIRVRTISVLAEAEAKNVLGGKEITIQPAAGVGLFTRFISKDFCGFTVYYTTDGTDPKPGTANIYMSVDESGELIVSPPEKWIINEDATIKTLTLADNCNSHGIRTYNFTVEKLNKPSYIPAETEIYKNSYISLESGETGAKVYYTLDGTEPTYDSPIFSEPFTISDDTTIKMMAAKSGMADSDVVVTKYTLRRTATPTFEKKMTVSGMQITFDCETENAKIYYTTNGDTPTTESTLYTEPFKLKKNTILSFVAVADNMKDSYTVSELIDVPNAEMQIVGISDTTVTEDGYAEAVLYFQNNPGVAAYAISVEYDNSVLTPVKVENLWDGIFVTNIDKGEQSGIEKAVSMVWLNSDSVYEDGNAAKLTFKVNGSAGEQTVPLYIKENGVINHLYETLDVAYMDGSVKVNGTSAFSLKSLGVDTINSKKTQYTNTKLSMTTTTTEDKLTVNIIVDENSGIGAYNISLLYDNEALTPVSVENGEIFTNDLMTNVTQPGANVSELSEITVLSCNDEDTMENGILYTAVFEKNSANVDGQMIGFADVMLVDVNGNEIIGIYEDVTVEEEIKTITTVESGMINVTPYNVPSGSCIIVAGYQNKQLAFAQKFINDGGVISFEVPDVEADTVKVFVWENMSNMKPLSTVIDEIPLH